MKAFGPCHFIYLQKTLRMRGISWSQNHNRGDSMHCKWPPPALLFHACWWMSKNGPSFKLEMNCGRRRDVRENPQAKACGSLDARNYLSNDPEMANNPAILNPTDEVPSSWIFDLEIRRVSGNVFPPPLLTALKFHRLLTTLCRQYHISNRWEGWLLLGEL